MGSTDPQICFEGPLVKVTKSKNTQTLWCTLDGACLSFYRNKRSSCMFTIEINRVKSVIPFLDKKQFEIVTEKSFLFSAETVELCQDWINHIEEAKLQDGQLILTSQKQEHHDQPELPRRGSLPQHNVVSNALKRLSSKSDTPEEEPVNTKPLDTKLDIKSSAKDIINRFSTGITPKETVCSPSCPSRPTSSGRVNSLLLRFSAPGSNSPSTSPVSPPPQSPLRPFSPKSPSERPTSSNILEQPSFSSIPARPLSVGHQPDQQKMSGITTTSTGTTKIDLSEVSSEATVVVSSRAETSVPGDRCTDSVYTSSGICSSPPKESQEHNIDQHTVNSKEVCDVNGIRSEEKTEEAVVLRPKGLTNGDVEDNHEDRVTLRRAKTEEKEEEEEEDEEEEEEDDEDDEQAGPNLQLLDDLMSLTFEETEVPQSSSVDLSALTELKELLTDLPTSLLLRRSVDVDNHTPVQELSQFLKTAQ